MRIDHRRLRLRVWWDRYRGLVVLSTIVAIVLWIVLTTAFFAQPLVPLLDYDMHAAFAPPLIAWHRATHRLVPILAFYEFIVVALAIVGAVAIVSRRIGDRFAVWTLVWAIVSLAMFAALGENSAEAIVAISPAVGDSWRVCDRLDASDGKVELDSLRDRGGARADDLRPGRHQFCLSRARHE